MAVLLDAYEQLSASLREEFDLVVAGPPGWGDRGALRRLQSGMPGMHYLGYVSEQDLPGLTAGATIFVYPSMYEGFGLPVAQSMAAGVPVVSTTIGAEGLGAKDGHHLLIAERYRDGRVLMARKADIACFPGPPRSHCRSRLACARRRRDQ